MSFKKPVPLPAQLTAAIETLVDERPQGPVLIGFSGGMDSSVLLTCAARSARIRERGLRAVHVHHGLQPEADAWAEQAIRTASELDVPIHVQRVQITLRGRGLEAAAREARLAVFESQLPGPGWVLFAHHQDDQAETVLLRLARGAALDGVAGMRRQRAFADGWLGRPWLDQPRARLRECAEGLGIRWVEDPANQSQQHDRVFLRTRVWPLLQSRFPAISERLARFANHAQSAQAELDQLAIEALQQAQGDDPTSICIPTLLVMSESLFGLCVRRYALAQAAPAPGFHELARLRAEVLLASVDANPQLRWQGFEFRRYRDRVYLLPESALKPAPSVEIEWPQGAADLALPEGLGSLQCVDGNGKAAIAPCALQVRFRVAGERIKPAGATHARELRLLFQERAVPTWKRQRIPLIFLGKSLICVVGMVESADFQACWPGLQVQWLEPRPAATTA